MDENQEQTLIAIKQSIERGEYQVDAQQVADAVLRRLGEILAARGEHITARDRPCNGQMLSEQVLVPKQLAVDIGERDAGCALDGLPDPRDSIVAGATPKPLLDGAASLRRDADAELVILAPTGGESSTPEPELRLDLDDSIVERERGD